MTLFIKLNMKFFYFQFLSVILSINLKRLLADDIQGNVSIIVTFQKQMQDESFEIDLTTNGFVSQRFGDDTTYQYNL